MCGFHEGMGGTEVHYHSFLTLVPGEGERSVKRLKAS
jgi:hypothetical protein